MNPENLPALLQSAYELSLTNGQHAFFLVHTHHQVNPVVFDNLIGRKKETSQEMLSAMEAFFLLVSESSQQSPLSNSNQTAKVE